MSRIPAAWPRTRRPITLVVAAVVALTLAGPLTGPAFADKYVAGDSRGDVVTIDFATEAQSPVPDNATADVVKVKVNHARGAIRFRVRLRDLSGPALTGVAAEIKTNQRRYSVNFFQSGGRTTFDLTEPSGEPIRCAGKKRSSNVDTDVVKFSVPRRCLDQSRWVRAGVLALVVEENAAYADDALRVGNLKSSGKLTFTGRLRRG